MELCGEHALYVGHCGVFKFPVCLFSWTTVNRTTTPATLLKPDDMKILKPLIQPIAAYWVAFADQLGMGLYVSTIQATPTNTNPPACLRDLLNRWIHHGQPSLEALCQALRGDPEIIGGNSVAMKLEEQFQG